MGWQMPGPEASPREVVEALRLRAFTALIYATDREQLVQMLDRAQLPNVTVQIVPQTLGFHPGLDGSVILLGFDEPNEPDEAFAETLFGRIQSEDEDMPTYVRETLDQLARDALSPDESLVMLERLVSAAE